VSTRLKITAAVLTVLGVGLFAYFVYAVGIGEIVEGITRFGVAGFALILSLFFVRILARAAAWKLSVHAPYHLTMSDTVPAVIIGEAMSSTIPLGILISGTAKAVAVRRRIPLVGGLSSVATENLFYSFTTGLFLIVGAAVLLRGFAVDETVVLTLDLIIGILALLIALGLVMVIRQWHFVSETCEWLYEKGYFRVFLEDLRLDVRLFENLIYGFYRHYPGRFLPICGLEMVYHLVGIAEVGIILYRLEGVIPNLMSAFLLESVSRLVTVVFKLIPFIVGVDEAGSQFIAQTLALSAGIGVTLAIIRKGRIIFWTAMGWLLIINRELHIGEIRDAAETRRASDT